MRMMSVRRMRMGVLNRFVRVDVVMLPEHSLRMFMCVMPVVMAVHMFVRDFIVDMPMLMPF